MHTQSEVERVECPLFPNIFLWLFSRPFLCSGRGFSNLYARFVYFCLSGYSGWCVSLTYTPHIPHLFLVISRLFTLDPVLSFFQVSVVRGISPVFRSLPPLHSSMLFLFCAAQETHDFRFIVIASVSLWLQLYGEYREQLGNFARREAARLLTERQWRRQAGDNTAATGRKGHGRRHHHQHPVTLESHHSHASSTKKPRPYSKCQGDQHVVMKMYMETFGYFATSTHFVVLLHDFSKSEALHLSNGFNFWLLCTL